MIEIEGKWYFSWSSLVNCVGSPNAIRYAVISCEFSGYFKHSDKIKLLSSADIINFGGFLCINLSLISLSLWVLKGNLRLYAHLSNSLLALRLSEFNWRLFDFSKYSK